MRGEGRRNQGRGGKSRYRDSYHHYTYGERDQKMSKEESPNDNCDKPKFREGARSYSGDSRISKQLQRLSREENTERFLESVGQLKESVMLPENMKYVRRNADYILDCLFEHLFSAPSRFCKWEIAKCIGHVGHVMANEIDRLFEATLLRLDTWKSTESKVLIVRSFYHVFELDHNGAQTAQIGKDVVKKLCPALERTETMEIMVAIVDTLKKIYDINPVLLSHNFQDVVDILVGWHIDYCQPKEVTSYVSLSLQSFYGLWIANSSIALTLLSQFVEDIEEDFEDIYSEEDYECERVDFERISAYVGAFNTVVRCLGTETGAAKHSKLPDEFLVESVKKMTKVAERMFNICCEESILTSMNQLCHVLLSLEIDGITDNIDDLINIQNRFINKVSCTNELSVLQLIQQVIKVRGSSLSIEFVGNIMDEDSILRKLRSSPFEPVWTATLEVYQSLFSIKNVALLQEAYKFMLQELQFCLHSLDLNSPLTEGCTVKKGSPKEAETLLAYLICVLADVANTRNSIITMWALKPSLVDLFATHINLSSEKMGTVYPQIQENGLFLLYSHSSKHSHYISSSSLVVGEATKFVPSTAAGSLSDSPPFSTSTSTSENLQTVINLINSLLKLKKGTSAAVLKICIEWAAEIIVGCECSLPQLMQKKPFQALISGIVNVAYHFVQQVIVSAGTALLQILKIVPFQQINCSEDVVKLCFYYFNHSNRDISANFMSVLSLMPLSVIISAMDSMEILSVPQNQSSKGETVQTEEVMSQDMDSVLKSQRNLFFRSSGQISAFNFQTIMKYLLQGVQPQDPDWLESLFSFNQRADDMTSHDMKFGALAPYLNVLRWKWLAWQAAQYCVTNKLKTTLGKPHDTFTSIENAIKQHAKNAKESTMILDEDMQNFEGGENDLLKVQLLLEFMESLEKAMSASMDGSAVTPQSSSKGVKIFFSTNRQTCIDWLSRMRAAVIVVALNSGQPHIALRHSYKLLAELVDSNSTEGSTFQRAVCYCAKSLVAVGCPAAINGLHQWAKKKIGIDYPWLRIICLSADRRYEQALESYAEVFTPPEIADADDTPLNKDGSWGILPDAGDLDSLSVELVNQQILECYVNLSDWEQVEKSMQKIWHNYSTFNQSGSLNYINDVSHIRTLSSFDSGDLNATAKESGILALTGFQNTDDWPLWRKQVSINSTVMHSLTALLGIQGDQDIDINESIAHCSKEIHRLFQISSLAGYSKTITDLIVNMQVIYQLKCILNQETTQFNLHENWDKVKVSSGCVDVISKVSRYSKLAAYIFPAVSEAAISKLDLINIRNARKRSSFRFSKKLLSSLLGQDVTDLSEKHLQDLEGQEFTILTGKIHQEAAKILSCLGQTNEGANVLANIVTNLNPVLAVLAKQDPTLISLPPNEAGHLCAKSILTLNKWCNLKSQRGSLLANTGQDELPRWVIAMSSVFDQMRPYVPEDLDPMCGATHSGIDQIDSHMGNFLALGTVQCPTSPKMWFEVASWSFKWGKRVVSDNEATNLLRPSDVEEITAVVSPILLSESANSKLEEICALLGCSKKRKKVSYRAEEVEEEDLRLEEVEGSQQLEAALTHLLLEWGAQMETVSSMVPTLLNIRGEAMRRGHAILTTSAIAYFKYLKLCSASEGTTTDKQMIATLRLLRMIVKYAVELKEVLQKGLAETPTTPWKNIIPQLFARLSHPEAYVRSSASALLCRIAKDFPHLIIFPAVVGASGTMSTSKGSFTDVLDKYFQKSVEPSELIDESEGSPEEMNATKEKEELEQEEEDDENSRESSEDLQRKTLMQNCFSNLVNSIKKQNGSGITEVQTLIHELRRITVLWDELWLGTLTKNLAEMSRKCVQLKADLAKLHKHESLTDAEKEDLAYKKCEIIFKPMVFALDHLSEITSKVAGTPNEKHFQETFKELIEEARSSLITPKDLHDPVQSLLKLNELHQQIQKNSTSTLLMEEVSPILANLKNTQIAMPGVNSYNEIITISAVGSSISILPTKTKPKKLSFQGSDGKRYTYLFKGLEDLHLDQRIMQFLETVNTMLTKNKSYERNLYKAHCYSVVPLGPRSGLIQWVGNATPLFGLYKRWQQREAHLKALKGQVSSTSKHNSVPHIQRPSELYYSKLTPRLKEACVSIENRKNWPLSALKEVFRELVNETPADLLSREMWQASLSSSEWWKLTHAFNISTAVMSIIGYVIGLGDRHLDNLLVNLSTGEVVHIDYNVCFEKGMNLKVPEKVPFRMTQNIEHALGVTGVEGVFRSACELVMQTMRGGKETLLTLLEAFIYDPLVDWTPDNEAGYTGAVYGGDKSLVLEAKQSRQRLEKSLTLSMFTVRLAEMKADWATNKKAMLTAIPNILAPVKKWNATNSELELSEAKLSEGHQVMAMIKEAEANPQHRLYSLISRYEEFTVVKNSLQSVNDKVTSKMSELQQWLTMYQTADSFFRKGYITEIRNQLVNKGNLTSSLATVRDHLASVGQSQLAKQYEMIEGELKNAMSQIVAMCMNLTESLGMYGNIWLNYPSDHLSNNRIHKHYQALSSIKDTASLENVQRVISEDHASRDDSRNDVQVAHNESKLRTKATILNNSLQKVCDVMQEEVSADGMATEAMYDNSSDRIAAFVREEGQQASAAIVCALINCLSQSLSMKLREDKALASTAESLPDMMIGKLWWFHESYKSLCSIVELVNLTAKHSPAVIPTEVAVIKSLNVLQEVFGAMQDLVQNSRQIIIVEGGRLLWMKEESVVDVASRLSQFLDEARTPVPTLIQQLTHHLHMSIFRMPSSYENAVDEANNLHNELMTRIQLMTDTSFSSNESTGTADGEMNQGQMLLMGFHLLFETIDHQLDRLIDTLPASSLPHPWPRVDSVKHSTEIMGSMYDHSIRDVVRAILKVKKVEAITSFFTEALKHYSDHNMSELTGAEDQLERIVRTYVCESIYRLLLGLPTYLATHFILIHCQKLKVDVTGYIESHDVGTEGRVPLEGIVEAALENSINDNNLHNVISTAANLITDHLSAFYKKAVHRAWQSEVESVKILLQRVMSQNLSYQWYYEDNLSRTTTNLHLLPNRAAALEDIRQQEAGLLNIHNSLAEMKEKHAQLMANLTHRLKWASGSNPNIFEALEEFGKCVEVNSTSMNDTNKACDELRSLSRAVCHYEAVRTNTGEAMTEDNKYQVILNEIQESCLLIERHPGSLNSGEELLLSLTSPALPQEISPEWVSASGAFVSEYVTSLTEVVAKNRSALGELQQNVQKGVDILRRHLSTHHKMMSDVRILLKSLAKFEQEGEFNGVDGFLCLYKRYSEVMSSVVRQLHHQPLQQDSANFFKQKLQQLLLQTYVIYDKLMEFGSQCKEDDETRERGTVRKKFSLEKNSAILSSSMKYQISDSASKKSHPPADKGSQEHNKYALSVWRRVKMKLEGKDAAHTVMPVAEQVDYSIREACNINNLATLYEGWTPWI